ncbi:MAG: PEP-utilizing enzyme [Clostridia bacterium]|nr:PEP-utilizing enzyme [Clostridia bacterium]
MNGLNLINIKEISSNFENYLNLIGGKAVGLAAIANLSILHPDTWVVTTQLFHQFKEKLQLEVYDKPDVREEILKEAEEHISRAIGCTLKNLPYDRYAVRSSAVVEDSGEQSFAGMFESVLNVTVNELPAAIARVWLSGMGQRVQMYFGEYTQWPPIAVVIQPMIDVSFAGVCFSRHPSPRDVRDNGRILVEVISGLGESLVQGAVTPLSVTGTSGTLVGNLGYPWIEELEEVVTRLEESTGGPVDVEFAIDREGCLWLLQQRPVTAIQESHILQLSEYKKAYKRTLCSLDIEFLIDGCTRYLAPYYEINLDLSRWMIMITNPSDGQQELWIHKALDSTIIRLLKHRISSDTGYLERLITRYRHYYKKMLAWNTMCWADDALPITERIKDFFESIVPLNAHYYVPMHIIEALSALMIEKMKQIDPDNAEDDFFTLSTLGITTLGQLFTNDCLNFKKGITDTLKTLPLRWEELSEELIVKLDNIVCNYGFLNCHLPYEEPYNRDEVYRFIKESCEEDRTEGIDSKAAELMEKYSCIEGWDKLSTYLKVWLNIRNQQMEYLYSVYANARPLLKGVGDILGMSVREVWNSSRQGLIAGIQRGKNSLLSADYSSLCLFHDGEKVCFRDDVKPVYDSCEGSGSKVLKGRTVFGSGKVEGLVKIAFSPEDLENIEGENIIVVTGMTTPDFVPVLTKKVAALITDEGGILCHAAIIAREIKLPCIVGTGLATEKLADGTGVIVDLDTGKVNFQV